MPAFVRTVFDEYLGQRELNDYYSKYRSLEAVYSAIIKYVGTTFALLAADHNDELKREVWEHVLNSSSLGGWVAATNVACQRLGSQQISTEIRSYCSEYSEYKKHPQKDSLDDMARNLNLIVDELGHMGYQVERAKSLNLIRAMDMVVSLRNKVAHGAFGPIFFLRVEKPLLKTLKLLMTLAPFSKFVCWGRFAGSSYEFTEQPRARERPASRLPFWIESDLLQHAVSPTPFLDYREESRRFYFLNSAVSADDPQAEYIDYASGSVMYREIMNWQPLRSARREIRPRNYQRHSRVLSHGLNWRNVPLTSAGQQSCPQEIGVYIFTTEVNLGDCKLEVILYVGKTTNLKERMASYLRILKKYDPSRPEIGNMFDIYGRNLRLHFAIVEQSRIASVERAIYETTMPEFNILAPPAT